MLLTFQNKIETFSVKIFSEIFFSFSRVETFQTDALQTSVRQSVFCNICTRNTSLSIADKPKILANLEVLKSRSYLWFDFLKNHVESGYKLVNYEFVFELKPSKSIFLTHFLQQRWLYCIFVDFAGPSLTSGMKKKYVRIIEKGSNYVSLKIDISLW